MVGHILSGALFGLAAALYLWTAGSVGLLGALITYSMVGSATLLGLAALNARGVDPSI